MVKQVGVLILKADDERVGEILDVGTANGADSRSHLDRFTVHQHTDVLLQTQAAQGGYDRILAHHLLPEYPVRALHRHVDRIGEAPPGDFGDQSGGPLSLQQATPRQYHPHIADRIFQVVGFPDYSREPGRFPGFRRETSHRERRAGHRK